MKQRQFRFKREFFSINGNENILGLVICCGHGYDYKTYCCKACGELFVVDVQYLHIENTNVERLTKRKKCPACSNDLDTHLIEYPENIFYNGIVWENRNVIDKLHFDATELKTVYALNT